MADRLQSIETSRQHPCPSEIVVSNSVVMTAIRTQHAYAITIENGGMYVSAGLEYRAKYNLGLFEHIRALILACIVEQNEYAINTAITPMVIANFVVTSNPTLLHWPELDELSCVTTTENILPTEKAMTDHEMSVYNLGHAFHEAYRDVSGFIAYIETGTQIQADDFSNAA